MLTLAPTQALLKIKTVQVLAQPINIIAIKDDHPLMQKAYRLWYEVYVKEIGHRVTEGKDDEAQLLTLPAVGSTVLLAMQDDVCVATLRCTYCELSEVDFDYKQFLPEQRVGELSKLIAHKRFRKTTLSAQLLIACLEYQQLTGKEKLYDKIVMATVPKLLPYYTMFGFEKASPLVHFPDLRTDGYILVCDKETNRRIVGELRKIVAGNPFTKLKWAFYYWWVKKKQRFFA